MINLARMPSVLYYDQTKEKRLHTLTQLRTINKESANQKAQKKKNIN